MSGMTVQANEKSAFGKLVDTLSKPVEWFRNETNREDPLALSLSCGFVGAGSSAIIGEIMADTIIAEEYSYKAIEKAKNKGFIDNESKINELLKRCEKISSKKVKKAALLLGLAGAGIGAIGGWLIGKSKQA